MFWRRKVLPSDRLVKEVFGSKKAKVVAEYLESPATQDMVLLYIITAQICKKNPKYSNAFAGVFQRELEILSESTVMERDKAIKGYTALDYIIEQGGETFFGMPMGGLFRTLDKVYPGQSFYNCTPFFKWSDDLKKSVSIVDFLWSWHHLTFIYGKSLATIGQHRFRSQKMPSIFDEKLLNTLMQMNLNAYFDGWMRNHILVDEDTARFHATRACPSAV